MKNFTMFPDGSFRLGNCPEPDWEGRKARRLAKAMKKNRKNMDGPAGIYWPHWVVIKGSPKAGFRELWWGNMRGKSSDD